jgi:rhamnosyltransferase
MSKDNVMTNGGAKISVLIPTLNAGERWIEALAGIKAQTAAIGSKIIVDSGSTDDTVAAAKNYGFEVVTINRHEFNHGRVRQQLAELSADAEFCVFLTQDAILATDNSINNLVAAFENPAVALAYGKQLPHHNARPLEAHARMFNYHDRHEVRAYSDKKKLGFKVVFCSNSFAAYRKATLNDVGGFPSNSIMGEDALVSARLLLAGYKVAYVADATVYHSHSYSFKEEFKRYFDTRVFHEQNKWLIDSYGRPTGEGIRYLKSEVNYIMRNHPQSLLHLAGSNFAKWLGYSSGKYYRKLPKNLLKKLSMHSAYWE